MADDRNPAKALADLDDQLAAPLTRQESAAERRLLRDLKGQ